MQIKEYPLEGLRTCDINILPDERGFFAEVMRYDWKDFVTDEIVQANMSLTYPGIVRAWHRHSRGQVDHFLVLRGASKICAYSDETRQLVEIVAGGAKPMLIRMPGHYYHGFKAIADEPSLMVYFTSRLYDYKDPDEERIPWNDPLVRPAEINGNKNDPRANQPWDWFYPPYK
jgi:dTDP-4-dehydrorhamnose 3,5-epimerase